MLLSTAGGSHWKTWVYPPEFRRRVLELRAGGRRVADLARDIGVSDQTIYLWPRQEQIDRGIVPGLASAERAELTAAKRRIRELEAELAIHRRASELLAERSDPKAIAAIDVMAAEGCSLLLACRVLRFSEVRLLRTARSSAIGRGRSAMPC